MANPINNDPRAGFARIDSGVQRSRQEGGAERQTGDTPATDQVELSPTALGRGGRGERADVPKGPDEAAERADQVRDQMARNPAQAVQAQGGDPGSRIDDLLTAR